MPVPEWQEDWSRRGVGFGDPPRIDAAFSSRISFVNSHIDRFPFLDLAEIPESLSASFEFAFCSEVLEHVLPPFQNSVGGLFELLQGGGFAVITVPIDDGIELVEEYYPGLVGYEFTDDGELIWTDGEGLVRVDPSPEIHGGQGRILALRRFGRQGLRKSLVSEGFTQVVSPLANPALGFGERAVRAVFVARKEHLLSTSQEIG